MLFLMMKTELKMVQSNTAANPTARAELITLMIEFALSYERIIKMMSYSVDVDDSRKGYSLELLD